MAWHETFWEDLINYMNYFMNYYSEQELPAQVLLCIVVVISLVVTVFGFYGLCWLCYQAIKLAIFSIVIFSYLIFTGIKFLGMLIMTPEPKRDIGFEWSKCCDNMDYIWQRFYPPKSGTIIRKVRVSGKNRGFISDFKQERALTFYCPNCGMEFTRSMMKQVNLHNYCYCMNCGQKFAGNIKKIVMVPKS
ncbi:MAG: hypothetical protein ACTSYS_16310 [Promethearchaeota archaeon]